MSWARDSIGTPVRQPYYGVLTGLLHAKLIPLPSKTRYAQSHVDCIIFTCGFAPAQAFAPAIGGGARRGRQRPEDQPVAGDRICRRACDAVDPDTDRFEGSTGRPYGRRGGV